MSNKRRSSAASGVQLGLIITPMLDMAFQILAFFIMTYHPSALEGQIYGSLTPDNPSKGPQNLQEWVPGGDVQLLPEETITVKIKAVRRGAEVGTRVEGSPSQIFLKLPLEVEAQLLADVDIDFDAALKRLEVRLKELAKQDPANRINLKIAADGELRQQYVVMVYDVARKAGYEKIHFVPPPVLNTKLKTQ